MILLTFRYNILRIDTFMRGDTKMGITQYFDGKSFVLDKTTGYYKHSNIFMHRYIWEFYNGKIPEGYEIHHKDLNRNNNDIGNLECISVLDHRKLHADLLTDEQREWKRNNLAENARPKASEWHKSDEGREWHKLQYERTKDALHKRFEKTCTNCGKVFLGEGKSKYCSNACKSAYRRKTGGDLVPAICVCCGKYFQTNKFKPSRTCSRSCANRQRVIDRRGR